MKKLFIKTLNLSKLQNVKYISFRENRYLYNGDVYVVIENRGLNPLLSKQELMYVVSHTASKMWFDILS